VSRLALLRLSWKTERLTLSLGDLLNQRGIVATGTPALAFARLLAKLNGQRELGDGALYRLCRELQRELFDPPLQSHHGRVAGVGKYSR
jgi:hypothetical protein